MNDPEHDELDNALADPEALEEVLIYHVVEGGDMPVPDSPYSVQRGMARLATSLEEIRHPPYDFDPWLKDLIHAALQDTRFKKTLLGVVFERGWMRGQEEVRGRHFDELHDLIVGGLTGRLQDYISRFHPRLKEAHKMTHRIYREHLEYINTGQDAVGRPCWEIYHTPTGFVIEDEGLFSEEQAEERVAQFPTVRRSKL